MRLVVAGLVLIALALAVMAYGRPRGGKLSRFAAMPVLDMLIPLLVTSGVALGFAMIVAGILT
jgi:hypothetical protein